MARRRRFTVLARMAAAPLLVAGVAASAAGAAFVRRAAAARRRGAELEPGVPAPPPSVGLAASAALDTLIAVPIRLAASGGSRRQYDRASAELDAAVRFYEAAGWLDDPGGRHPAPTCIPTVVLQQVTRRGGTTCELIRFDSGWRPHDGEPGGDRWRALTPNATVAVRLLRHLDGPRPWLVAVHGQGMGRPSDARLLRARRLHEDLGVNVALPVLPLHGPRAAGLAADRQFVSNVFVVNNVFGLTQAVWDLRRLLLWLRGEHHARAVGLLGLSLGSYVGSLLATFEADLACVIAVVPTSDLADSLRSARPLVPSRARLHGALHDERSALAHRVVSPLARPCLVPHGRRLIVAGQADRIAAPAGAARLWRHWGEPAIEWRPRGHVTTARSPEYDGCIAAFLARSGIVP